MILIGVNMISSVFVFTLLGSGKTFSFFYGFVAFSLTHKKSKSFQPENWNLLVSKIVLFLWVSVFNLQKNPWTSRWFFTSCSAAAECK